MLKSNVIKNIFKGDYKMTEATAQSVKFDPGYAQHTTILSISLDFIYQRINSYKNFGQKKAQFRINYPKIVKMTENNVGFCLGSILWAVYIKSLGDLKIEGNPCLGDTFTKEDTVGEIDYSINYFTQLRKDAKYYMTQNYDINPLYIKILELYKEFLLLNENFVNTKTTNDVKLPPELKTPSASDLKTIHEKIEEVIKSGNLIDLTEVLNLVYEEK